MTKNMRNEMRILFSEIRDGKLKKTFHLMRHVMANVMRIEI